MNNLELIIEDKEYLDRASLSDSDDSDNNIDIYNNINNIGNNTNNIGNNTNNNIDNHLSDIFLPNVYDDYESFNHNDPSLIEMNFDTIDTNISKSELKKIVEDNTKMLNKVYQKIDGMQQEISEIYKILNIIAKNMTGIKGPMGDKGLRGDKGPIGERGPMGYLDLEKMGFLKRSIVKSVINLSMPEPKELNSENDTNENDSNENDTNENDTNENSSNHESYFSDDNNDSDISELNDDDDENITQ